MPIRPSSGAAALLAALLLAATPPDASRAQSAAGRIPPNAVAIVAHPGVPVDGLTLAELRDYFMARRRRWPNGQRVTLLVRDPENSERQVVLHVIYDMTESRYLEYWTRLKMDGTVVRGPTPVRSSLVARQRVVVTPGSIAFIPARMVTRDMKQLRINGKLPGQPGYPLQ